MSFSKQHVDQYKDVAKVYVTDSVPRVYVEFRADGKPISDMAWSPDEAQQFALSILSAALEAERQEAKQ